MKVLLPLFVAFAAHGALALSTLPFKHLSGPPSEFDQHRTPSPEEARTGESSFLLAVTLAADLAAGKASSGTAASHYSLAADSDPTSTTGMFAFAVISPLFPTLTLSLLDPEGSPVSLQPHLVKQSFPATISSTGAASQEVPAGVYQFKQGQFVRGTYKLTIADPSGHYAAALEVAKRNASIKGAEEARIIIFNDSPVGIVSRLTTYQLRTNSDIGIEAWVAPRTSAPESIDAFVGTTRGGLSWHRVGGRVVGNATVSIATIHLTLPDGGTTVIPMRDDGLGLDRTAHDGVYTGSVRAGASGTYLTQSEFIGRTADGFAFVRSAQQMIPVVSDSIALTGHAVVGHHSLSRLRTTAAAASAGIATSATPAPVSAPIAALHADVVHSFDGIASEASAETIRVYIGVKAAQSPKYYVYAEVWGAEESVPALKAIQLQKAARRVAAPAMKGGGWVGGYSIVERVTAVDQEEMEAVEVFVDSEVLEKLAPPYALRNVALYDSETGTVVGTAESIELPSSFTRATAAVRSVAAQRERAEGTSIHWDSVAARYGPMPASLMQGVFGSKGRGVVIPAALKMTQSEAEEKAGTALSHGYCASENPFYRYNTVWTHNPVFFLDPLATRTNDAFALLIHTYVSRTLNSYGFVGHSQGGPVGTHLLSFYWSGMDRFSYPALGAGRSPRLVSTRAEATHRPVQSIGSPYQGSTAAGSAANLGKAFGIGCGSNSDLSLDGAKLWLAKVPTATRQNVFYATTTYQQGNLLGDSCNLAMNLILQWPNDGVSETKYTPLSGGNDLGNTQKQCHTVDMSYIAQYDDTARNSEFNRFVI